MNTLEFTTYRENIFIVFIRATINPFANELSTICLQMNQVTNTKFTESGSSSRIEAKQFSRCFPLFLLTRLLLQSMFLLRMLFFLSQISKKTSSFCSLIFSMNCLLFSGFLTPFGLIFPVEILKRKSEINMIFCSTRRLPVTNG